jgi:hypothetical protein
LYKYEILQHRGQRFQPRRRHATLPDHYSDTDTEPEETADTDEQTSGEEGIEPQKRRVAEYIQRIEKRMFTIISADRKGWMGPYRHDKTIKSFAP